MWSGKSGIGETVGTSARAGNNCSDGYHEHRRLEQDPRALSRTARTPLSEQS